MTNLEDLDVSYNNVEKIAYDIGEMASLTNFNLYSNNLTVLPTTIGNLPKLMTLNLGVNQLEELPEEMRMLVTLHGILECMFWSGCGELLVAWKCNAENDL